MYTRPTFMGFETAKTSIFANQKSLDIVGNNLANVNTVGYTRQSVDRASMVVPSYSGKTSTGTIGLAGQGVESLGVSQTRDSFLDLRFRQEYANSSYHSEAASILDDIQLALGDGYDITDEAGLYSAVIDIYSALNSFVGDPTSDSLANIVLSSFTNICQVLTQLDTNLTNVANNSIFDLGVDVDRINEIASQIADINKIIEDDSSSFLIADVYYGPNELYDARNLLLDELAYFGEITVTDHPDGSIDVTLGGFPLIERTDTETLNLVTNDDLTVSLNWVSTGESYTATTGALLANIHFINGAGVNCSDVTQEPYQGIVYYRDQLDTFANALSQVANNTVPECDEDGNPLLDDKGNIVYKTLLGAQLSNGTTSMYGITAGNITISDEWNNNGAGYFVYSHDEYVEDYAQELAYKLTEQSYSFNSNGTIYEGTFLDFHVNMVTQLASDVSFHAGRQDSYALIANDLLNQRDAVAGVSTDEETADMLIFQKSYEAASRMMTVFDELLDVIINSTGRVGL
ncbi:MAG: flagellar hook-associated protein FlgK [Clostridia bacterium]